MVGALRVNKQTFNFPATVSVADQAGLNLTLSETPKTGFLELWHICECRLITLNIKPYFQQKIAIRDGKSPDLKVNDKQLQTANLAI